MNLTFTASTKRTTASTSQVIPRVCHIRIMMLFAHYKSFGVIIYVNELRIIKSIIIFFLTTFYPIRLTLFCG